MLGSVLLIQLNPSWSSCWMTFIGMRTGGVQPCYSYLNCPWLFIPITITFSWTDSVSWVLGPKFYSSSDPISRAVWLSFAHQQLYYGLPQSTIWSPGLFNIYMRLLEAVIRFGARFHQYIRLCFSVTSESREPTQTLNLCLDFVMGWVRSNSLNLGKTEVMWTLPKSR